MKRRFGGAVWAVLGLLLVPLVALPARGDLSSDVKAVLLDKLLAKADVGIEVVRLGDSAANSPVIFRHESELPLVPASNLKVITTSAALDGLGADFKFHTALAQRGRDLALIGDGDPTFGDAEMLKKVGWDATTVFRNWAEAMKKKGITRVDNVLVDDSVFEENGWHPHWPPGQRELRYCAEVGGLNLNANCVDFTFVCQADGGTGYRTVPSTDYLVVQNNVAGGGSNAIAARRPGDTNNLTFSGTCPSNGSLLSVTVHDPSLYAGSVLATVLKDAGIQVTGKVQRDRTIRAALTKAATPPATTQSTQPAEWALLAVHETPLLQVIARANKDSMNLYAEALCKRLGFAASGESGSWENGTAAVGAFLRKAGATDAEFHLDDGCGLSHQNTISPNAIVSVLKYDYFSKNRQAYLATLSVAGSDGTLERRFPGQYADLRGRVIGKSGFVEGVSSLSGFLHAKDDRWYAFSILMNGIPRLSNSMIKPLQEAIVRAVDREAERSAK